MLTQAQIDAEDQTALTGGQVLTLTLLVKQYPPYMRAPSSWPDLETKLSDEQTTPTIKTQALKAALTALADLPEIVVESNGSAEASSFFSSPQNWGALAQDVLNTLYDVPIPTGSFNFALTKKTIQDGVLKESVVISQKDTGRRY